MAGPDLSRPPSVDGDRANLGRGSGRFLETVSAAPTREVSLSNRGLAPKNIDPWWPYGAPDPAARVRLLCLPFAGGGASVYRRWRRGPGGAPPTGRVDVCPIQLPGREGRIREAPLRRIELLAEQVVQAVRPHVQLPYVVFGYSMGALLAYEVAQRLIELRLPAPRALFVAAAQPPHRMRLTPTRSLPDSEFVAALRAMKGTPEEVLAHEELMELLLPTLRADFEACETYVYREAARLSCPVVAFGGTEDPNVSLEDLNAWGEMTTGAFASRVFPGDHFFFESHGDEMLRQITEELAKEA